MAWFPSDSKGGKARISRGVGRWVRRRKDILLRVMSNLLKGKKKIHVLPGMMFPSKVALRVLVSPRVPIVKDRGGSQWKCERKYEKVTRIEFNSS